MPRGRTPKPADDRHGHHKRAEVGKLDDDVPIIVPLPPRGLLKPARLIWAAFWRSRVAMAIDLSSDRSRLVRWICDVDEYERVHRVFLKVRVVDGSAGQPVLNPLAGYLDRLKISIERAELEFGMTPLSRIKLGAAIGEGRMTAAKLDRMLNDGRTAPAPERGRVPEPWEGEWEEA